MRVHALSADHVFSVFGQWESPRGEGRGSPTQRQENRPTSPGQHTDEGETSYPAGP